jgi:hypothetical protein
MSCPEYSNQFGLTQYDGQCAFFEGVFRGRACTNNPGLAPPVSLQGECTLIPTL